MNDDVQVAAANRAIGELAEIRRQAATDAQRLHRDPLWLIHFAVLALCVAALAVAFVVS